MKNKKKRERNSGPLRAAEKLGEVIGNIERKLLPSLKEAADASRREIAKFAHGNLHAFHKGYSRAKKKSKKV